MNILPGWFPGSGADVFSTLTFIASAASAGVNTIVAPGSINPGDLLVLLEYALNTAGSQPTGFSIAADFTDTSIRQMISYKIADGSEDGATLTGLDATSVDAKVLMQFRGNTPILTVTPLSPQGQRTSGDPTAQVIPSSAGVEPTLVLAGYGVQSGAISPRDFTPAKDGEANSGTNLYLAYKIHNVGNAAVDYTVDMPDAGSSNFLTSCYLNLTG